MKKRDRRKRARKKREREQASTRTVDDLARRLETAEIPTVNFLAREYPYEGFEADVKRLDGSSDEGEADPRR